MIMPLDNCLCLLAPFGEDVALLKFTERNVESCTCQKGCSNLDGLSIQGDTRRVGEPLTIKADMTNKVAKTAKPKYSMSCFASALSAAFSCWSAGT